MAARRKATVKKFYFMRTVEAASGWQTFSVEARSEAEARVILAKSGGQFEEEEVEITRVSAPELVGEEEVAGSD